MIWTHKHEHGCSLEEAADAVGVPRGEMEQLHCNRELWAAAESLDVQFIEKMLPPKKQDT